MPVHHLKALQKLMFGTEHIDYAGRLARWWTRSTKLRRAFAH